MSKHTIADEIGRDPAGFSPAKVNLAAFEIEQPSNCVQSISRATTILRLIARRGREGVRLSELTRVAGLPHSTIHRLLQCLISERLVAQHAKTRRYQLGALTFELGLASMHRSEGQTSFRPQLERMALLSGDTAYLIMQSGIEFVCLERVEGRYPIRAVTSHVGGRRPIYVGAGGLALLSQCDDKEVEYLLKASEREITGHAGMTIDGLHRAIERTRARGYAIARDAQHIGLSAIGMAVPVGEGGPRFAVTLAMVTERLGVDRITMLQAMMSEEIRSALQPGERTQDTASIKASQLVSVLSQGGTNDN
jgi:DNA-binding IclR family transcriptional regulator